MHPVAPGITQEKLLGSAETPFHCQEVAPVDIYRCALPLPLGRALIKTNDSFSSFGNMVKVHIAQLLFLSGCLSLGSHAACPYMDGQMPAKRADAKNTDEFLGQFEINDDNAYLTSDAGGPFSDQNSLSAGDRGPTLLEDFIFRQKIQHFDHERVPERAVHARGAGAHGTFVSYGDWSNLTGASFLAAKGKETPVFLRFSTVAGSRGSADTARDVHGFAVRLYTDEGNFGELLVR